MNVQAQFRDGNLEYGLKAIIVAENALCLFQEEVVVSFHLRVRYEARITKNCRLLIEMRSTLRFGGVVFCVR